MVKWGIEKKKHLERQTLLGGNTTSNQLKQENKLVCFQQTPRRSRERKTKYVLTQS